METNQDYTTKFRGFGEITVPKGTRVSHQTAMGIDKNYHFVTEVGWVYSAYPKIALILIHDLTYYGLNVPKEFVTGL